MEENKDLKYVYFIYSLEKNKKREIKSDYPLKLINIQNKTNEINFDFIISLYRITIGQTNLKQDEKTIKIQLIVNDDYKSTYEYLIDINDNHKNIFLYDIEFKNTNNFIFLFTNPLPLQCNLTIDEKYETFRPICIKKVSNREKINEKKMEDLIYYSHRKLESENHYNFSFFSLVLNDISIEKINDLEIHFELFNISKIIFDEKKICIYRYYKININYNR